MQTSYSIISAVLLHMVTMIVVWCCASRAPIVASWVLLRCLYVLLLLLFCAGLWVCSVCLLFCSSFALFCIPVFCPISSVQCLVLSSFQFNPFNHKYIFVCIVCMFYSLFYLLLDGKDVFDQIKDKIANWMKIVIIIY